MRLPRGLCLLLWVLLPAWLFSMATSLPSLAKTWQFSANNLIPSAAAMTVHRGWLKAAKDAMKGFAESPWTVVGSANSAAAGLDAVDRWSDVSLMTSRCWIVLKQTGIASNFQLCWENIESGPFDGRNEMFVSQSAGFTGGAIGTRPTATDEVAITVGVADTPGVPGDYYINVAMSTDGQCTRLWGFSSFFSEAYNFHWSLIDRLYQPISELTIPWAGISRNNPGTGAGSYACLHSNFIENTTAALFGRQGATDLAYQLAPAAAMDPGGPAVRHVANNSAFGTGLNNLSGDYVMVPMSVACTTASNRGVHGELADLWSGSSLVAGADTYPEAAYAGPLDQFVHIGNCVIHPWDNSVPLVGVGTRTRRQGRVIHHVQTFSEPVEEGDVPLIHTAGFGGLIGAALCTRSPIYTSGAVWFVSSTSGTDAASPAGKSREQPLASLAQAQTNAAAGDVVVLLASHSETLGTKLTLSKAGLIILGEGAGSTAPTFARSADVNLFDLTGAGIRLENLRFATDGTAGFTADRVLITANSCIVRGCYFVSGVNDSVSPALAVASGVTNLRIDGATQFVSSGTSKTATGFRGLALNGTSTDVELDDVTFDGGSYGWLSNAWNGAGAVTRLRAVDVDLLNGSDVVLASSTVGYIHTRTETGAARIEWP